MPMLLKWPFSALKPTVYLPPGRCPRRRGGCFPTQWQAWKLARLQKKALRPYHHGGVDAFACQGVNVAGCIPNDQQMVIVGSLQALAAQAQGRSTHALHLGIRPHRLADEGITLQRILVQPLEVRLLQPHMQSCKFHQMKQETPPPILQT